MIRAIVKMSVVALLIAATSVVHAWIPGESRAQRGAAFIPRPDTVRAISFGFDAVLADFYWLWAVQIVGGENDPSEHATDLGRLIDVVTTLDPWVDHPYRFAAVWMTDSEANVREANRLLERAIDHHPEEWRNHYYLGFNHFFYLQEYAQAATALERAVDLPGAPVYLARLVARVRSHGSDLESAGLFLQQLVGSASDEVTRAQFQAALDEIEVEYRARELDRAREVYLQRNHRDIRSVLDLVRGEGAVMESLPPAEPSALPAALRRGSQWQIDPETSKVVSTYYGRRYVLNMHTVDKQRSDAWRIQREQGRKRNDG